MHLIKLAKNIYPLGWMRNPYIRRLPEHYLKYRLELTKPPVRVHDDPITGDLLDYKLVDEKTLRIERVPDLPVGTRELGNSNEAIFAGENVVTGFDLPKRQLFRDKHVRNAKIWVPNVFRTNVYSEVLDTYLSIVCTKHALDKIHEAHGFDNYILRTPIQDLQSLLALKLRRKMLIALAKESYHPNNPEKYEIVKNKYQDCKIPLEEAEWIGLSWAQAIEKMHETELEKHESIPLKVKLGKDLLNKMEG